jgi:hypothetical protein
MATETETTAPRKTPQSSDSPEKRTLSQIIGKRNPDNDAVLQEIAGHPVSITAAESEQRQGKRRKYWVTTITLEDGRTFTVVGNAVREPLSYLQPEDYPVLVTFTQEPSDFEPGAYYWAIN